MRKVHQLISENLTRGFGMVYWLPGIELRLAEPLYDEVEEPEEPSVPELLPLMFGSRDFLAAVIVS